MTALLILVQIIFSIKSEFFSTNIISRIRSSYFLSLILLLVLLISRNFLSLSDNKSSDISYTSAIIIFSFSSIRFCLATGFVTDNLLLSAGINLMCLFGLLNGIFRLSVKVGYFIDCHYTFDTVYFGDNVSNTVRQVFRFSKNYFINHPTPHHKPMSTLNKVGVYAAIATVPIAAVVGLEVHKTRIATERSADMAERAADANDVDKGRMPLERYKAKWDDYSRK